MSNAKSSVLWFEALSPSAKFTNDAGANSLLLPIALGGPPAVDAPFLQHITERSITFGPEHQPVDGVALDLVLDQTKNPVAVIWVDPNSVQAVDRFGETLVDKRNDRNLHADERAHAS